jgi:hypothetical protein
VIASRWASLGALFTVGAASAVTTGCGGGSPLLHPARTLPAGDVRAAAGVSAHVAPGSLGDDVRRSREIAGVNPTPQTSPEYAKGAIVAAAVAPGLAPFVAARVGVGNRFEGGLAYTGRNVRVDMRRSFDDGAWSLSLGLGASAALYGRQQGTDLPNVSLQSLHGYGADVPVLVGWQSTGGVYMAWGGLRGGFERVIVEQVSTEPKDVTLFAPPIRLDATRFYGGAVLGVATGFNHVHVALEIAASYQSASGTYNGNDAKVHGVTLTPASALWWTF